MRSPERARGKPGEKSVQRPGFAKKKKKKKKEKNPRFTVNTERRGNERTAVRRKSSAEDEL